MPKKELVPSDRKHSIIYVLIDPFSGDVKYVGQTTRSLSARWSQHMCSARSKVSSKNHRDNWIRSLIKNRSVPHIEELDHGYWNSQERDIRECYWIDTFVSKGANLTNHTLGGSGGYHNPVKVKHLVTSLKAHEQLVS